MESLKERLEKQIKEEGRRELWFDSYKLDKESKELFVENIRRFLLVGTHANSETRRILTNITPCELRAIIEKYYIFTRFYCYLGKNNELKFNYCAGQDYIAERKAMRELICKKY